MKMKNEIAVGVWSITNNMAVELLGIEHGIEDIATVREPGGKISEHEIQYTVESMDELEGGTPFITVGTMQLHFDECMRV